MSDSAGVEIVVVRSLPDTPSLHLSDAPVLSLGAADAPAPETFDNVRGVVRLADGTLLVGDGGSNEIRSFSAEGKHLGTFGGTGDGPGEFRGLGSIVAFRGDSVAGVDGYTGKVAVFDRNGRFGSSFRIPTPRGSQALPWVRGTTSDDQLVLELWRLRSPVADRTDPAHERVPVALALFSSATFTESLIGTFPGNVVPANTEPVRLSVLLALRQLIGAGVPMEGSMVSAARGDIIAAGTTDLSEIRIFRGAKLVRILRFDVRRRPIDDGERDRIRTERLRRLGPESRSASRESIDSFVDALPDSMPGFGMIRIDAEGRLWVARYEQGWYETGPSLWWVFGTSGRMDGSIMLPAGFRPAQVDDSVIVGVHRDSLWVQRVQEYTFRR